MRALRPQGTPAGNSTPWLILGLFGTVYAVGFIVWLAGRLAAAATGHAWSAGPGFGIAFIGSLARGRAAQMWPGIPGWLIATFSAVLIAITAAAAAVIWRAVGGNRSRPGDPLASLASPRDVEQLTPATITERAQQLRPSLAGRNPREISASDTGVLLGTLQPRGPVLRASWEDVIVAFMAPRSAKTTALAIPTVLAAPAAAVATSNKADLWAATAEIRRALGKVWPFDPQSIVFAPQTWWADLLEYATTVEEAERLAGHFVLTVDDPERRDIWGPGATELMSALILAARISGRDLNQVYAWLTDDGSQEPVEILEGRAGFIAQANGLRGIQNSAWETKTGIYQTARTAARCLRDPQIMAWVTPPKPGTTLDKFSARDFVKSKDTLYLMSKDGGASAAPLIAALTDRVLREAVRRAESLGGRLDPPMPVVLDEASNICRIADLPNLYSHLGSRGIPLMTILQSYAGGEQVWGRAGMQVLWGAATLKVIGAGIDDPKLAEDLSRLVGDHDVPVASYSRGGRDNTVSESVSLRRQRILAPDDIRALRKGTALLLATGSRAALIELHPWYTSDQAARISAAVAAATKELRARAEQRDLMAS